MRFTLYWGSIELYNAKNNIEILNVELIGYYIVIYSNLVIYLFI